MTTVNATVTFTPPPGPTGPAGPEGATGPQGPAGPSPDINALATAVAAILGLPAPGTPPVVSPPVTTPPAGAFWLYKDGVFVGAGDYSYGNGGSVTYGPSSVIVKGDEAWQPRMPADKLDTTPYTYLLVSIKPTQNQVMTGGMEMIGDIPIPGNTGMVDFSKYGPNPMVLNQWNDFKIPLSAYGSGMPGRTIYKIGFQGASVPDPTHNQVEFNNVGFV